MAWADAKKRIDKNRKKLLEYKQTLQCKKCGLDDHRVLEFHHVEPRWKTGRPKFSDVLEWKWERIRDELVEHCVLLCPNCHKLRHMKEDGEGRFGNEVDF